MTSNLHPSFVLIVVFAVRVMGFCPSARWARSGIVVPFVRLRRRTQSFGYYTNIVQHIKFIQPFNPSRQFFLLKVEE